MNKTEIWGLTGGIASGKSTVAGFFSKAGIPVIDADQITHDLSAYGGKAHEAILKRFKTADRRKLREIVFADAVARKDLEAILHPLIHAESQKRIERFKKPRVIYEAALLVETGRNKDLAELIVVTASAEVRLERLMARGGFDRAGAARMISAQTSDEIRLKVATHVIENSGSLSELEEKVRVLISKYFI